MNKSRKAIIIALGVAIIVISGLFYYNSYVNAHSSKLIVAMTTISTENVNSTSILYVNVSAEINSTNSLTSFNFHEDHGPEGVDLVYAGQNKSVAVNLSEGTTNSSYNFTLEKGFIHFNLSSKDLKVNEKWNGTVFNFRDGNYTAAPNGYYYMTSRVVGNQHDSLIVTVPSSLIALGNSSLSIIPP